MSATALSNLWGHGFRLFATVLSITLCVTFMAGTLVLPVTIHKTFDNLLADVYRGTGVMTEDDLCVIPEGAGPVKCAGSGVFVPSLLLRRFLGERQ